MRQGYDRALYILPFDHRGSFQTRMFGWKPPLSEAQTAEIARAKRLSEYLAATNRSGFMFELLVPADKAQLEGFGGDKTIHDRELRPRLMVQAVGELQHAGVEPDLWKVEELDRREDCRAVVRAARAGGRDHVNCIVLGRGENRHNVPEWLNVAAGVQGFIGFAVGRTEFWDPLIAWRSKTAAREQAVAEIAARYRGLVDLFEEAGRHRAGSKQYAEKEA